MEAIVTRGKKATTRKPGTRKLKVKKDTIRDLDAKSKGRDVKGGANTILLEKTCFACVTK